MKFWIDEDSILHAKGHWPKTDLGAIKAAIQKWETIRDHHSGEFPFQGMVLNINDKTCALCRLHIYDQDDDYEECAGCPVQIRMNDVQCWGTPYYDYKDNPCLATAQAEVDFLKSLLNENHQEAEE